MTSRKHSLLLPFLITGFVACGDDGSTTTDADLSTATDAMPSQADAMNRSGDDVPAESDQLFSYLQANSYAGFAAEDSIHDSGIHTRVRVFFNSTLADSLTAGNTSHPIGSATIKELFTGGTDNLRGWAVMVKVDDKGSSKDWYYYENFSTSTNSPVADGTGPQGCAGCHSDGTDYVFTNIFE